MRLTLPILCLGVVAASCLASAASNLPSLKAERWVNSPPLTPRRCAGKSCSWTSGSTPASTGFARPLCQSVEPRLRAARPGRHRRALAGVRVRQARREYRSRHSRPRTDLPDRHRQRLCDLAGVWERRVAREIPLRRSREAGEAMGRRGKLRRNRDAKSGVCWLRHNPGSSCRL